MSDVYCYFGHFLKSILIPEEQDIFIKSLLYNKIDF